MSEKNKGYYYHPLGDLAKAFADGTASDSEWPHTYDDNGTKPHGYGNLDWGSGDAIPPNSKVYSMTDGTITSITKSTGSGGFGFYITIKTDKVDGVGKTIYIYYIELAGFSEKIATALGCKSGPMSQSEVISTVISFSSPIEVEMGEHIAYTNDWYSNYSNMHTDFLYEGQGDNNEGGVIENRPQATADTLSSSFDTDEGNPVTVTCNGKNLGRDGKMVRTQAGNSELYPIWPHMSYMVCQQTPQYISGGKGGAISIGKVEDVLGYESLNQDALTTYKTKNLSDNWMGKRPETLDELNGSCLGARYLAAVCSRELNFSSQGNFPGASYGKLIRAKMISEKWSGSTMKDWFESLNEFQFAGKTDWITLTFSSSNDLRFAQLCYDNVKYPDIYGQDDFTGTDEFKDAIIYACQQIPIFNLWEIPSNYKPLYFCINFDVSGNKELGESGSGGGHYLLYRNHDAFKGFNPNVLS